MKNQLFAIIFAAVVLFSAVITSGCTKAQPDAGHEAVWVMKPLIFGHGGIDPTPVKTGLEYGAVTSDYIDVSMLPQRVDMEFDDMMTSSGVPVSFHVVGTFRVTDSVILVSKFGADRNDKTGDWGFWQRNLDQPIRTAVRDSVKKRGMQEMAIFQTSADEVGAEVKAAATQIVQKLRVPVEITDLNVGKVNPPDAIKTQRIETAAQEQRAITEQRRKLAEDQRKAAEFARADADNAYNEKMRISPEQFVRIKQIEMMHDVCGKGNCTFLMGGGVTPVLDMKK